MKKKKILMSVLMAASILALTCSKSNADTSYSGYSGGRCAAGAYQDNRYSSDQQSGYSQYGYGYGQQRGYGYGQQYGYGSGNNNPYDGDDFNRYWNGNREDRNTSGWSSWFGRSRFDGDNGYGQNGYGQNGGRFGCPTGGCAPEAPCGIPECGMKEHKCPTGYNWQRGGCEDRIRPESCPCPTCKTLIQKYGYGSTNGQTRFNPAPMHPLRAETAESFKGVVKNVTQANYPGGAQIHAIITTDDNDEIIVILGPESYVNQAKVKIQAGDKVLVTGSRVRANGDEMIIANEISKNGNVLQLRDSSGNPMWGQPMSKTAEKNPTLETALKKEPAKTSIK